MPNFILSTTIPEYNTEDILVAKIDGSKSKTLVKFFTVISKELYFPDYFGANLDSFDEMINDLTWLEQEAVIIVITHFDDLLKNEVMEDDEDCKGLILSLLDQAADDQKNTKDGIPIKIIIEMNSEVIQYLNEMGIEFLKT